MPKEFSKQFKAGKLTAHVRQKKNGVYEIYCQPMVLCFAHTEKYLAMQKQNLL